MKRGIWAALMLALFMVPAAQADNGSLLWLRYTRLSAQLIHRYTHILSGAVYRDEISQAEENALDELDRGLSGLLGGETNPAPSVDKDGVLVIGTEDSAEIKKLHLPIKGLGRDGYILRSVTVNGHRATVIAAKWDNGLIHGVFDFLGRMQRGEDIAHLNVRAVPKVRYRVLSSSAAVWNWDALPEQLSPRYTDYARANAALGINGVVLNGGDAGSEMLQSGFLDKEAALYHAFWNWGVQVYLPVRLSAPVEIGGLPTADPGDARVRAWWRAKAKEIYRKMPFFGGFLAEPAEMRGDQAGSANMLADALEPYDGIVMWRVAARRDDPTTDPVMLAYNALWPQDRKFRNNVILQVKNGFTGFQLRAPFHPLFGAMPHTNTGIELQVCAGEAEHKAHLIYLGTQYHEAFAADTFRRGRGTPVSRVVEGRGFGDGKHTLVAGVTDVGGDRNRTGSVFNQANWYAFGRMAWNPSADPEQIARDWVKQTFRTHGADTGRIVQIMMMSRAAAVDTMAPMGLSCAACAREAGIGVDRTVSGSDALSLYAPAARKAFDDLSNETYLLWFHRLPWDFPVAGHTLRENLVRHYNRGMAAVSKMQALWAKEKGVIDDERFEETSAILKIRSRPRLVLKWETPGTARR